MKRALQAFSAAFVIFLAVGYYQAWQQRRNESDYDTLVAAIAQTIDPYREVPLHAPTFIYHCGSLEIFEYDMNSGTFVNVRGKPVPRIFHLNGELSNIQVTAIVTGVNIPQIVQMVRTGEGLSTREIVAGVAGALTGYNLGKWLAASTRPKCASDQILGLVQNQHEKLGSDLARALVNRELKRYWLVEVGKPTALVDKANLDAIRHAAESLPRGNVPMIYNYLIFRPGPPSRDAVEYVCNRLSELQDRMGETANKYRPNSTDFEIAENSLMLAAWVRRSPLEQKAFPHLYRVVDSRDLESAYLEMLQNYLSFADSAFLHAAYVTMFVVGGIFCVIVIVIGVITISDWYTRLMKRWRASEHRL